MFRIGESLVRSLELDEDADEVIVKVFSDETPARIRLDGGEVSQLQAYLTYWLRKRGVCSCGRRPNEGQQS